MKLYLTATSERGKPVTKSGNDYIKIEIYNKNQEVCAILCINHPLWFKNPQMSINYNKGMIDLSRHDMEMESQKIKGTLNQIENGYKVLKDN